MIILIYAEMYVQQNPIPIHNFSETRKRGISPTCKENVQNPRIPIMLGERLNAFLIKSETRHNFPLSCLLLNIILKV